MRIAIAAGLAVLAASTTASATTTIGIEWEFTANAGVIATTDGTPAGQKRFIDFDVNDRVEEKILCTAATTNGLPYVTVTYDMEWNEGPVGAHTIEIVTGPIDYAAGTAEWSKVTRFVTHFFKTLDTLCVNEYVSPWQAQYSAKPLSWWNSETICYVKAADIITEMNRTAGAAGVLPAQANAATGVGTAGVCGGEYSNPANLGFFKRKAPLFTSGKWYSWHHMESGNTQVNVAVDVAAFASRPVEMLFNNGFGQSALAAVRSELVNKSVDLTNVTPALHGFLLLQGYALNVRASAKTRGSEYTPGMVADKNLYDLYPKAKLGELYALIKPGATAAGDAALKTLIEQASLCLVNTNGACGDVTDGWKTAITSATGDPVHVAKPIAPIASNGSYKAVMEMRLNRHAVNQAARLVPTSTSGDFVLADLNGLATFFQKVIP